MFTNNFDPVAIQIFSLEIRWYSLAYILGILLGWVYCKKRLIKDKILFDLFDDFMTYLIIGIILGGRLGYVFFYNFSYYFKNPIEILMIWSGGMSFHGGLIGVFVATIIFSKINRLDHYIFLDMISLVSPIGIFFGRLANFINSELYGRVTNVPWSVEFKLIDDLKRHPSQIYEAIFEGIILFILLNYFSKKDIAKTPGALSGLFLIFYSFFRFIIEFFRNPDPQIGYLILDLTMGQFMSLIFLLMGLILFYLKKNNV